jgi:hypothetical protein
MEIYNINNTLLVASLTKRMIGEVCIRLSLYDLFGNFLKSNHDIL